MKRRHPRRSESLYRDIARQRIVLLYQMAVEAVRSGDTDYARMLGGLAWDMYRSTRVKIPRRIKRGICRRCKVPLVPGVTARVRLRSQSRRFSYIVVTCLLCGWRRRYPYKAGGGEAGDQGGSNGGGKPEAPG